jgi:Predicted aminopeptidases
MKKLFYLFLFVSLACSSSAQDFIQTFRASSDSLKKYVYFLASDSLKGRKTGSQGQEIAATFIAGKFKEAGLSPISTSSANPYFQSFTLYSAPINIKDVTIKIKGLAKKVYMFNDVTILSGNGLANTSITPYFGSIGSQTDSTLYTPVITANSIDDGLNKINRAYTGKEGAKETFLLALPSEKVVELNRSRFVFSAPLMQKTNHEGDTIFYTPSINPVLPKENIYYQEILPFLAQHPNINILLADEIFLKKLFSKDALEGYPHVKKTSVGKTLEINGSYAADKLKKIQTENVVGILKGTKKRNEAIILCAHYDHIGTLEKNSKANGDSICNGADDNASGTSAILEVARLLELAKSKGYLPNRTIILAAFTGEELGLYGSTFMVNNPIFPLNKTVAVVNLDMVGRSNESHFDSDMYVYPLTLGNSNSSFEPCLNQCARMAKIDISDPISEREQELWTHGSDHDSFVSVGIPAIVFTTGEHADYHTPADEASKINYPRMERITNLVFYTIWKLANL